MPMPDWYDPSMMYGGGGFNPMMQNPQVGPLTSQMGQNPAQMQAPPGLLNQGAPPIPGAPSLPNASPAAAQAAGAPLTDPQRAAAMQQLANSIRGAFPTPQPNPNAPGMMGAGGPMRPPGAMPFGAPQGGPIAANQMNPAMMGGIGGQGLQGNPGLMQSLMGRLGQQRPPLTAGPMGGGQPYF